MNSIKQGMLNKFQCWMTLKNEIRNFVFEIVTINFLDNLFSNAQDTHNFISINRKNSKDVGNNKWFGTRVAFKDFNDKNLFSFATSESSCYNQQKQKYMHYPKQKFCTKRKKNENV